MPVNVSGGVAVQPVHDVLQLGVEAVDDGIEGHGVLVGVDHQLEVRVPHLGEKHVDGRPLLEPPPVFVLETKQDFFLKLHDESLAEQITTWLEKNLNGFLS